MTHHRGSVSISSDESAYSNRTPLSGYPTATPASRDQSANFWLRSIAIALLAFIVHLILVLPAAERLAPSALDEEAWSHSWYYSDPWRVLETQTTDKQLRNNVHPFYGLVTNPPTRALMAVTGLGPHPAAMAIQRAVVFAILLALTTLLVRLRHKTLDVALGALLVATSASLLFFSAIVETFTWGALSILLALHILHRDSETEAPSVLAFVSAGLVSIGMTITNWMAALIGLLWEKSWLKRALVIVLTLFASFIIIAFQKLLFEGSPTPSIWLINEMRYISFPDFSSLLSRLLTFLLYAQIAPAPVLAPPLDTIWSPPVLSMLMPLGQARINPIGWLGWAAWCALIIWAVLSLTAAKTRSRTIMTIGLFVLFQCALHLVYGESPFLYALHFTPFLAVIALEAVRSSTASALWIARGLVVLAVIAAIPSNLAAFDKSLMLIEEITPEALRTRHEILRRPTDFTPQLSGRVFIGELNAPIERKGVVLPGGTFSPAPGSFGISIARDTDGAPSSENLLAIGAGIGYRAASEWSSVEIVPLANGAWRYRFETSKRGTAPVVHLRGFGPAGGPLTRVARTSDRTFVINDAWRLSFATAAGSLTVRNEKTGSPFVAVEEFASADGWVDARIETSTTLIDLTIEREGVVPARTPSAKLAPLVGAKLDDPPFLASLRTQTLTLAASISENETRPYDPLYADGAWPQDTAYTSVALAAAGQADLAKAIVRAALPKDFYGDYGSEAHAPGLSLWALDQVARRTADEALLAEAWPHVLRKVAIMRRCTDQEARGLFSLNPSRAIFPRHRFVCGPPLQGLVTGEIGLQVSLSHATAFIHAGYAAAANIAQKLGHENEARLWAAEADRLEAAWNAALAARGSNRAVLSWAKQSLAWLDDDLMLNTRLLAQSRGQYVGCFACNSYFDQSALWPTRIGARSQAALARLFDEKHATEWGEAGLSERPPEPATIVALAHQLLYAGNTAAARVRLDWLLANTQSPKLAQWGSTAFNETPRGAWANLRAAPSADRLIEPHYWTAAEVLLLQLDMLAYVAPGAEPTIVLAAGSTASWRAAPASAGPIFTELGPVCWQWDGLTLRVSAPDGVRFDVAGAFADVKAERAQFACP